MRLFQQVDGAVDQDHLLELLRRRVFSTPQRISVAFRGAAARRPHVLQRKLLRRSEFYLGV